VIAIVNRTAQKNEKAGKITDAGAVCQYDVMINNKHVAVFYHDRSKPLSRCLMEAAMACANEESYKLGYKDCQTAAFCDARVATDKNDG